MRKSHIIDSRVTRGSFALALLLGAAVTHGQDLRSGEELYFEHGCYSCHGFQGKGTHVERANNLFPKPPILLKGQSPFLASEEVFRAYLRLRGEQAPAQPSVRMPNYPAATLSDEEVALLYQHVSSFAVDEPPLEEIDTMVWILEHAEAQ